MMMCLRCEYALRGVWACQVKNSQNIHVHVLFTSWLDPSNKNE